MNRETKLPRIVQVRLTNDLALEIDDWRRVQPDIPTRSEAIRRLLELAIKGAR